MTIQTDGLVIKERKVGESDKLIWVLTSQYGLVRAFVRRANSVKSAVLAGSQLLTYSDFVFYKGKDSYSVNAASPKHSFFALNDDMEAMACAFYLAELFGELAPENEPSEPLLKLLLNSLYLMAEKKRSPAFIKSVAELRALSEEGYRPNLIACENCGTYETDPMYFNPTNGILLCKDCGSTLDGMTLSLSAVTAMRFITFSEPKKIFNFKITDQVLKELNQATEQFVLKQTSRDYRTLEFYKSIPKL